MKPVTPGPHTDEAERLATLIREQAAAESAETTKAAQEQAEHIRAAAQAEAESIRTAAEQQGESRGRRRAAELLAVAGAKQRMSLLQVRESLVEEALAQARTQLDHFAAMPSAANTLAHLIAEGLPLFPAGVVHVRTGKSDAALLKSAVLDALAAGRWVLKIEPSVVPGGGVILESDDRRLRFDNSFEARSRRRRDRLRQLAAKILLGQGTGHRGQP